MFAGQMKLNTFLIVAGGALLVCGGGAAFAGWDWWKAEEEERLATATRLQLEEARRAAEAPPAPATPAAADATPIEGKVVALAPGLPSRRDHQVAFSYRDRDLGSDKKKDVASGEAFKVNVYQDAGHTTANRAKIDLDRDDKWDEKLTFEPDRITLQVAPADDERYTETYHWSGTDWVKAP